jgi:ABC-type dipeptide/oligopeptide/nickel transport system ATPase component
MTNSAIATDNLSKSYGSTLALDALSLEVTAGEIFGLLGHNGAGKTTTVNVLTTLLEPTYGNAEVAGHSVTADAMGVRRSIGYLPENVGHLQQGDAPARRDRAGDRAFPRIGTAARPVSLLNPVPAVASTGGYASDQHFQWWLRRASIP